ncbi:uncharacterized protein PHACADRAFT_167040 [Phanerochaete carnosa HHB-10118-sp]|uniref:F-box domain-containing protein n=1 Tax=Phanerochaete carnosa (strain HHB-10118-sp) TaxID=650164 RepID=K5UJE3_PHACS|nr:uncharacterized protein PHACADRAFT_167040 [Phanerochaete carnosa HHB-10118-sp]EKM49686.1 hypothetical protein PHACADRAFT_167040 [Phanerochaete carnosa HHB-10118-sp]
MHIQEFPEELLVLILEMCLLLSPADFFDETRAQNVGYRRISLNIPPACDILLVCKQWARIGTPMLYSSLLLVSRRHAAKVAPYLKNNQHVAERITYMRISGRYSRELLSVARCAPNVKAVCVFPPFDPTPSGTENLSEILSILDPESLYIGHLGSSMIAPFVQQSTTLVSHVRAFLDLF